MPRWSICSAVLIGLLVAQWATACPFCAAESRTLSEEIADSSVVVIAALAVPAEAANKLRGAGVPAGLVDPETGSATFDVERVLVGEPLMKGVKQIQAIYFGEPDTDRKYFIRGADNPPDWAIPLPLSEVAAEYVPKLMTLPPDGADRLAFFQPYLQHSDALLAQDAYDEFARAPYQDVVDLGPRMDRAQLMAWIEDPRTSPSRRRLFLTMLGVCGEAEDLEHLREMLASDARLLAPAAEVAAIAAIATNPLAPLPFEAEAIRIAERQRKLGLDALVACYLTLAGKHADPVEALDLVDERFLADPEADYSNVYAALQALRFLAEEQTDLVPLNRILRSARLLLKNQQFADQVIPDLARWEDWSLIGELEQMYRDTYEDREGAPVKYVREPIITYLDVAAEQPGDIGPVAEAALKRLEPLDPKTFERARRLQSFGMLAAARAKQSDASASAADEFVAAQADRQAPDQAAPRPRTVASGKTRTAEAMPPNPIEPPRAEPRTRAPSTQAQAEPGPAEPAPSEIDRPQPNGAALVGVPLFGAAGLVGVFWLILRGSVA